MFSQHSVPSRFLVLIGDMTVSFAMLEMIIRALFRSMIQENQRVGQILAAQLSFNRLSAATLSLYRDRHGDDDDFDALQDLLGRAATIEQERNLITHSYWGARRDADTITRLKSTSGLRRGYQFQTEDYDDDKLRSFVDQIKVLAADISHLQAELIATGKAFDNPW